MDSHALLMSHSESKDSLLDVPMMTKNLENADVLTQMGNSPIEIVHKRSV